MAEDKSYEQHVLDEVEQLRWRLAQKEARILDLTEENERLKSKIAHAVRDIEELQDTLASVKLELEHLRNGE